MIIELERFNKIGELLIENGTTGSQGHICYQDGGQRVSVTMAAVRMGVERWGCKQGTGVHMIGLQVLRASALHYLAGDRVTEGFRTVASARALRQPTIAGPSIS